MKKAISLFLVLILAIGLVACADTKNTNQKTIAVIITEATHPFWQAVKAGAEAAGAETGYRIAFQAPEEVSPESTSGQIALVHTALSNGVSGIVLTALGKGFAPILTQAYDKHVPVVGVASGIYPEDIVALTNAGKNPILKTVATSDTMSAALAAQQLFSAIKADIAAATEPYCVGVIQHDQTSVGADRAKGFTEKFQALADADATTKGKYTVIHEIRDSGAENAYASALNTLYDKGADTVFLSSEAVVAQVYEAIAISEGKFDGMKFCGFGAGEKQIAWVKATAGPALIGSVTQDPYNMGYHAVMTCIQALEGNQLPQAELIGIWYDANNVDQQLDRNLVYTEDSPIV